MILFIGVLQLCIVLVGCGGTEKREETYQNGKIKLRYFVKEIDGNFLKHGLYSTWYPDGTKKEEIVYEKGKKHGKYISWYENGAKYEEGEFKNDQVNGDYTWWYENGTKGGQGQFLDGLRDGTFKSWHSDGRKKSIANFSKGTMDGEVVILDNQNECTAHFKDGLLDGKLEAYYAENACNFEMKVMAFFKNGVPVDKFFILQNNTCDNSTFSIEGRFMQDSSVQIDSVMNVKFEEGRLLVGDLLWHNNFNDFFYSWQGIGGLWDNYHFGTGFFTDLLPKLKYCIAESEK
jgi:antitoxin component YwqK of YwqJK toxin-antitoxin module